MSEEKIVSGKPFLVIRCPKCGQLINVGEFPIPKKEKK